MTTLQTTATDYELTWDEFVIEVEDLHLIETGADLGRDDYATVLDAFERGLSPTGCVMVVIDARYTHGAGDGWSVAA
jgi:hypothetical protein